MTAVLDRVARAAQFLTWAVGEAGGGADRLEGLSITLDAETFDKVLREADSLTLSKKARVLSPTDVFIGDVRVKRG